MPAIGMTTPEMDGRLFITLPLVAQASRCVGPTTGNAEPEGDRSVLHPAIPLTDLDDSTLISQRSEMRSALEKLSPKSHAAQSLMKQYDALNEEFGRRVAWARFGRASCRERVC